MRKQMIGLILILMAISSMGKAAPEWYAGVIHNHSNFSDGSLNPIDIETKVYDLGCKFHVITDHYQKVLAKGKIDEYLKSFGSTGLLCVVGAEFTATSKKGPHILFFPLVGELSGYKDNMGQKELLNFLGKQPGSVTIVAHPFWQTFAYDFGVEANYSPGGIEIFNTGDYTKTFDAYIDQVKKGKLPSPFSGWDYHRPEDPTNGFRVQHLTYVWVDGELTAESLVAAIANGQVYASDNGARLFENNYFPSLSYQEVERPWFSFKIDFPFPTATLKKVRIYRDGELVKESVKSFPIGRKEMTYSWKDEKAAAGKHSYIIEVEGSLVASPICLSVMDKPFDISKMYGHWKASGFSFDINPDGTGSYRYEIFDGIENAKRSRRSFLDGLPHSGNFRWEKIDYFDMELTPYNKKRPFIVTMGPISFTLGSGSTYRKFYFTHQSFSSQHTNLFFVEPDCTHIMFGLTH